jgi:glutamyl-tRNA reductase
VRDIDSLVVLGVRFTPGLGGDLAFAPQRREEAERRLRAAFPAAELAVLATCNRTELLIAGLTVPDSIAAWHVAIGDPIGPAPCLGSDATPYVHTGLDAVRHLCRVACGLDSAIVGEVEIVGQLREVLRRAEATGSAGRVLRRAFRAAFAASKAARATTAISTASPGIGVSVATLIVDRDEPGPVVVVGTGAAAHSVTRQLTRHHRAAMVLGRDLDRATAVAGRFGAIAGTIAGLAGAIDRAAAVVLTVPGPVPEIATALHHARPRMLVVDLGQPATADPNGHADLVGLEELTTRLQRVPDARRAAVPEVEAIIDRVASRCCAAGDRPMFIVC